MPGLMPVRSEAPGRPAIRSDAGCNVAPSRPARVHAYGRRIRRPRSGWAHPLGISPPVSARPAAAPFDPVRVLEVMLGVVETRPPEKFDQAPVVVDETDDLIIDGDRPATGMGEAVDDYRGTHASRVHQVAAHSIPRPPPAEQRLTGRPPFSPRRSVAASMRSTSLAVQVRRMRRCDRSGDRGSDACSIAVCVGCRPCPRCRAGPGLRLRVAGGRQLLTASAICRAAWAGVRCVVSTTSASLCSHVRAASA